MRYSIPAFILGLSLLTSCIDQAAQVRVPILPEQEQAVNSPTLLNQARLSTPKNSGKNFSSKFIREAATEQKSSASNSMDAVDAWQKITDGRTFCLDIQHPLVTKRLKWYTGKQLHFDRIGARARLYMPYIIQQVEQNDLPLELALLPFVESAYNPFASSPNGAAGLWQFIQPTGDLLGLKRNTWYDGRRDIISSTDAAIRYFKQLNKRFEGDWLLTLAAYNAGEGTVAKAIEENREKGNKTDFWSLNLPEVTRRYVSKLIALTTVIAAPENYQVSLPDISSAVHFKRVDLPKQIDLYRVSQLCETSTDMLNRLNPGLQQSMTPPEGPHHLLIPDDKVASFKAKLASIPKDSWLTTRQYTVRRGETLNQIALHHKTSVNAIIAQNEISTAHIRQGQVLNIPSPMPTSLPSSAPSHYHQVRQGDNLWAIAQTYHVSTKDLVRWNNLDLKKALKIGRTLKTHSMGKKPQQASFSYKVKKGDSITLLSQQFNVAVADILRWNKLDEARLIQAGQTLEFFPQS